MLEQAQSWPAVPFLRLKAAYSSRPSSETARGFAVAGGGSGLIMALVGIVPDAPVQPEGAVTGMRLAYILVPTVGDLLAIWVMRDYDVTEQRAKEIRAELERRRGKTLIV